MKSLLIILALGLAMTAQPYGGRPGNGPANRDDRGGYVNRGGNGFIDRIVRGERMGLITRREAARLYDMERDLRYETERSYRSGFGMSGRERDRIESMRIRLDREITRQMRDGERDYRGDRGRW